MHGITIDSDSGNTRKGNERCILVGTYQPKFGSRRDPLEPDVEDTLEELKELTLSAGADVVELIACRLERVNPATYINRGKVEEIAEIIKEKKADLVIFDDELLPRQSKNLDEIFGVRTIDRRALILDIFAKRAQTREGQLQVELAQTMYLLPRLTRMWTHLERQKGGGIGMTGPGEKQIELDRRLLRDKARRIRKELDRVKNTRHLQREKRKRTPVSQVVLVGYTNSGKSTLFNRLMTEKVLAANQLFATLDPTTRRLLLKNHREVLVTDSVGFIRKLPHELVEAFKATLEEVQNADLLLHVIDASNPLWESQKRATEAVLKDLDALSKPTIEVFNKLDLLGSESIRLGQGPRRVFLSGLTGEGLDTLLSRLETALSGDYDRVQLLLPQGRGDLLAVVHREGRIISQEYKEDAVHMTVELPHKRVEQWKRLGYVILEQAEAGF